MVSRLPILQPAAPDGPGPAAPVPLGAKRIFVDTYGCQMNQHDSDRIVGLMAAEGYAPTDRPEDADLIVINSCSVREKAEHKLLSAAGKMKHVKRARPDVVLALAGCVASQEGEALLDRVGHADLVIGPDHIARFPELVRRAREDRVRLSETEFLERSEYAFPAIAEGAPRQVSAFVTVMKGCDKFCTFCVVPMTRGREVSRSADEIAREVEVLAENGTREVVLLGQTVNSYGRIRQQGQVPFHELLARVAEVPGIERIRFTSPHPAEFSGAQIEAFRTIPKLCPHMHLPVQSGSTKVLRAMRRGYTREEYLEVVDRFREACPGAALSTDIIVGFPGETRADFEETLSLMERVRFHSSFSFAYSERTGTKAVDLPGALPKPERLARLQELQLLQEKHTAEWLLAAVGQRYPVLIEGPSKTDPDKCSGRTPHNRVVHLREQVEAGTTVEVEIAEAFKHSLVGRVVRA